MINFLETSIYPVFPIEYFSDRWRKSRDLPRPEWRGFVRVHHCFTLTGRFTRPLPPILPDSGVTLHTSPSRPSSRLAVTRSLYSVSSEYLNLTHPLGRGLTSNWEIKIEKSDIFSNDENSFSFSWFLR